MPTPTSEEQLPKITEPVKDNKTQKKVKKTSGKKKKKTDVVGKLPIVTTGSQGTVTLKNGLLQLWKSGKVLCSSQIPKAATPCDEYKGVYVDKKNRLVILQTYEKKGKFEIDYTILAHNVQRVMYKIWADNIFEDDKSYIFQDKTGKYRLVEFENRDALYYADFSFHDNPQNPKIPFVKAKSKGDLLINDKIISKTKFTSWGGWDSGITVSSWEIDFTIKGHGRFFCEVYTPYESIRISQKLYEKMTKEFPVKQYEEKLEKLIQVTKKLESN